jgi:EAL domain-containing protein (putative c-di-GMP-specific phosphodiesterase class I)/GGDEF domain-containing protein
MRVIDAVHNEEARLNALRDLKLLETPPSESFDRLTRLASQLLAAPVSTVSLTDRDRQWFKSRVGLDITEIPREKAPCSYAIQGNGVFVVPDLEADPRFADSPLTRAGIRFYAGAPLFTRAGHGLGTICVVDVRPRRINEEQKRVLRDLAGMVMSQVELQNMIGRVDATSGLPNQHQLFEDIEERATRSPGQSVSAVLIEFVSGSEFHRSQRVVGPYRADRFAERAMAIVQHRLGNSAKLYHVGPVRCVALLDPDAPEDAAALVATLSVDLGEPIDCDGIPLLPHAAFGTCEFAAGAVSPRDVLRRLIAACDDARVSNVACATYSSAHDELHARNFALVNDFAAALRADAQLSLVYQPRIDIRSGRLVGAEALLRWQHPRLGAVMPGEFVPLLEQTALVRPMTEWVARTALAQAHIWHHDGLRLRTSINASALNLSEPDFAERLLRAIEVAGIDTSQFEVEFTESAVARDPKRVIEQLDELKRHGVAIAIDDFGTGYSNLGYIQHLPVSVLKIDRSFIVDLDRSPRARTLVSSMVGMAHDLGYTAVAEGIETQEAYDILVSLGCDEGQGHLISPPIAPRAFEAWCAGRVAA